MMDERSEPNFSFSVEQAVTVPDKGVMVTGVCEGASPAVGDLVRFQDPEGAQREAHVLAVASRVVDGEGQLLEGRTGLVLDEMDRKRLKPPLTLSGFGAAAPGAQSEGPVAGPSS